MSALDDEDASSSKPSPSRADASATIRSDDESGPPVTIRSDDESRPSVTMGHRIRWIGLIGTLVAASAIWVALRSGAFEGRPVVGDWDPTRLDRLAFLAASVLWWFVAVPVLSDPRRRGRIRRTLGNDRIAAVCVGYLVIVTAAGTVGVAALPYVRPPISASLQPPVFAWTTVDAAGDCLGPTLGDRCFGTPGYPFGTDHVGRGVGPGIVEGAGVALRVALVVSAIAMPIAVLVGTVAGLSGGRLDGALMRYVDVQSTLPAFLIYLIVAFVYGRSLLLFVVVFGLLSWGGTARLVRSEVLRLRETTYVAAARAAGVGRIGILRRHLVANLSGTIFTAFSQTLAWILLVEAALAFLGLSAGETDSWGTAIANGFQLQRSFVETWWVTTLPMLALLGTAVSLVVVGDRLRDATDRRSA